MIIMNVQSYYAHFATNKLCMHACDIIIEHKTLAVAIYRALYASCYCHNYCSTH